MDTTTQNLILNTYQVESIGNLLQFKVKSDCCFRLPDDELFYGHTLVLAHYSPVFKAMFFGPMACEDNISVTEVSKEDFVEAMEFLYTGTIKFRSVEHAWSIFYISNKYLLKSLEEECCNFIKTNLSLDTLLLSYEYALLFNLTHLIGRCRRDILLLASDVFAFDYHIQAGTFCALLEESCFNIPESRLVEHAINWAETECKSSNLQPTPKNIKIILTESGILSRLRFKTLNADNQAKFGARIFGEEDVSRALLNSTTNLRFPLHLSLLYKFRKPYKIETTVECHSNILYTSEITAHHNTRIYGIAISAPFHNISFKAQVTLDVSSATKKLCSKTVNIDFNDDDEGEYEHPLLVNLDKALLFEAGCVYKITLKYEYKNIYNFYGKFLVFYMDDVILISNSKIFEFKNENFAGVVKGIAYYKV